MLRLPQELLTLADLVLPTSCAGCGARGHSLLCSACARRLSGLAPFPTRPVPAPRGLPETWASGWYGGVLRSVILGYKERGRRAAATVLGELLGDVVLAATPAGRGVVLLPIPSTAAAMRGRYGDHLRPVVARAIRRLRARGRPAAMASPLRALPRRDSAGLTAAERVAAARLGYAVRSRELAVVGSAVRLGATPVLVDDIVTTGATLAAAVRRLRTAGLVIDRAAVLAATRKVIP